MRRNYPVWLALVVTCVACSDSGWGSGPEPPPLPPRSKLEGTVTSTNGTPLRARVGVCSLADCGLSISIYEISDSITGWYSGPYVSCTSLDYLEARAHGYATLRKDVECRPGVEVDVQRIDFVLEPLPE